MPPATPFDAKVPVSLAYAPVAVKTSVPPIVAVEPLVPCPDAENVPVWLALEGARPVTFTGYTTKSPVQSGAVLVLKVNLAGYAPSPMKAPVVTPRDMPQSTLGQFPPWQVLFERDEKPPGNLPSGTAACAGFVNRAGKSEARSPELGNRPGTLFNASRPGYRLSCWCHQRGLCCRRSRTAGSSVSVKTTWWCVQS